MPTFSMEQGYYSRKRVYEIDRLQYDEVSDNRESNLVQLVSVYVSRRGSQVFLRLTFRVPMVLRVSVSEVEASSCRDKSVIVDPDAVESSNPYCCLEKKTFFLKDILRGFSFVHIASILSFRC